MPRLVQVCIVARGDLSVGFWRNHDGLSCFSLRFERKLPRQGDKLSTRTSGDLFGAELRWWEPVQGVMRPLLVILPHPLRSALLAALHQANKAPRPRARGTDRRGQLPNITPIAERPAEVPCRLIPGHWEGDILKGARNGSAVDTLVEQTSVRGHSKISRVPGGTVPRSVSMTLRCS